jgi:hypothetical protein
MKEASQDVATREVREMSPAEFEEIRSLLKQRKADLTVNQQILFKHASDLPPARRTAMFIAGWGPIVIFPFAPILYFIDWKVALFTVFLSIFWVGMGRKYAQAVIRRQCFEDRAFLSQALSVGLVKLIK